MLMKRPLVPAALFLMLVVSVVVSLPLQGSVVVISVVGFVVSLAGLAWWVLWADRAPHPAPEISDPVYDDGWDSFERAFWAHVEEHETTWDLD